jgi:hypothetical protein
MMRIRTGSGRDLAFLRAHGSGGKGDRTYVGQFEAPEPTETLHVTLLLDDVVVLAVEAVPIG